MSSTAKIASGRRFTLRDLADTRYLRSLWTTEISKQFGDQKFSSKNLVTDPLQGAVIRRNIDDFIGQLSRDLRDGRYIPQPGTIVRSAKSMGISRPVCVLQPRDALVYRAIVKLVEPELLAGAPAWVGFPGAESEIGASDEADSLDWFERWVRHEKLLPALMPDDAVSYVVQSDISNFFPSVRMEMVREHLSSNTSLDPTLVRLCCQIIQAVHPRVDYSDDSYLGLPQETHNSSRVIAQAVLRRIDTQFAELGRERRYSRYMDDVVWGVSSLEEGYGVLATFQRCLEELGLYPNSSKTKILPKADFVAARLASRAAEISEIQKEADVIFDKGRVVSTVPSPLLERVQAVSAAHRSEHPQQERWPRITRQIYTLHRRLGLLDWGPYWERDLIADPGGASVYFEYLRSWPLSMSAVGAAERAVEHYCGLYDDLEVMFAEAIATAPVGDDENLWAELFRFCFARFEKESRRPGGNGNLASVWFVAAAKYGNRQERIDLVKGATAWCRDTMSGVIAQCAALDPAVDASKVIASSRYGPAESMASDFTNSVRAGDPRSLNVVRGLLNPVDVLAPVRSIVRPRALLFLDHAGGVNGLDPKQLARVVSRIRANIPRLRDHRTEFLLSSWLRSASRS